MYIFFLFFFFTNAHNLLQAQGEKIVESREISFSYLKYLLLQIFE